MALDFPTAPNVGDTYGRWIWNGTGWVTAPGTPSFPSTGGAITGDLTVTGDTLLQDLEVAGDLSVQGQATFDDGVTIDGEEAATEDFVNSKIEDLKNLGFFAGSFDTHADLPANTSAIPNLTVNDFVTVRADETHADATTRYIATAIAGNGDIIWTYDLTYSTDVSGKMDKVPTATAGNVAVFDASGQVEDAGSALDATSLQFRPMTPNIRNWIPIGLEGVFVGEGTGIANAPTAGRWRYLAFAKASGALNLIAFEDEGGPMKPSPLGRRHQRLARAKRNGGVTLPTDGWSTYSGNQGLSNGWGEYQQPLFSMEAAPRGNLNKIGGRNLLQIVPTGNIAFGPRYSGPTQYRNPTNLSLSHRRLIETGAGGDVNANYRLHLIPNIWNLRNELRAGVISPYIRNDNNSERIQITMYIKEEQNTPWENTTVYRRWNGTSTYRMRASVSIQVSWAGPTLTYNPSNSRSYAVHRRIIFIDCRAMNTASRWTNADGSNYTADQTQLQGIAFSYPRQANIRVHHVGPTFDNSPAGKIFKILIDVCPVFDTCMATVFTYTAPLFAIGSGRPGT